MSFPWHVGSSPPPPHRRVIAGNGFDDPRTNFLSDRANEQIRQEKVRSNNNTNRLNTRATWENTAEKRLEAAKLAREQAQQRLKDHQDLVSRKDRVRGLYKEEFSEWLDEAERTKQAQDSPSLEQMKEKVAAIQSAREEQRLEHVNQSLDKLAVERSDLMRPYTAQARMEQMVDGWDQERAERDRQQQQQAEKDANFFNQWTPRYDNPTAHINTTSSMMTYEQQKEEEARKALADYEMKREKQQQWSHEWEKNRVDRLVLQEEQKVKETNFLNKWVGVSGDGKVNEDNMYVWRDPAEDVKKLGDDSEVAVAQLSLDLDFKSACGDPEKAAQFTQDFIQNMAAMLGCDPSSIVVNKLSEGSVVVNFTIETNSSQNGTPPAPELFAQLQSMVQSGAPILGVPVLSLLNKTPDDEKLEQQKIKMMQRNSNMTYLDYNMELAKHRSMKKQSELEEERQQARQDAERDQWALEEQKRLHAQKQQEERETYLRLEEERRQDRLRAQQAEEQSRQDPRMGGQGLEAILWKSADAEIANRRRASAALQREVEEGRRKQQMEKEKLEEERRRQSAYEAEAIKQQDAELKMIELETARSRKEREASKRLMYLQHMEEQKQRREYEQAQERAEEEKRRQQAAELDERFKAYIPRTKFEPQEYRQKGLRLQPYYDSHFSLPPAGFNTHRNASQVFANEGDDNAAATGGGGDRSSLSNQQGRGQTNETRPQPPQNYMASRSSSQMGSVMSGHAQPAQPYQQQQSKQQPKQAWSQDPRSLPAAGQRPHQDQPSSDSVAARGYNPLYKTSDENPIYANHHNPTNNATTGSSHAYPTNSMHQSRGGFSNVPDHKNQNPLYVPSYENPMNPPAVKYGARDALLQHGGNHHHESSSTLHQNPLYKTSHENPLKPTLQEENAQQLQQMMPSAGGAGYGGNQGVDYWGGNQSLLYPREPPPQEQYQQQYEQQYQRHQEQLPQYQHTSQESVDSWGNPNPSLTERRIGWSDQAVPNQAGAQWPIDGMTSNQATSQSQGGYRERKGDGGVGDGMPDTMVPSPSKQWSSEVDKFIHGHLSVRIAMSLIALKASFLAANSVHEAKAAERKIRAQCDVLDSKNQILALFEPAFSDPSQFCRFGGHYDSNAPSNTESFPLANNPNQSANYQTVENANVTTNNTNTKVHSGGWLNGAHEGAYQNQHSQPPQLHHEQARGRGGYQQPQAQSQAYGGGQGPKVDPTMVPRLDLSGVRAAGGFSGRRMDKLQGYTSPYSASQSTISLAWD